MPFQHPDPIDGPVGRSLWERADRVMVGGGIYLSRSADMAGRGVQPGFIVSAEGCRVTDADGRTYVDLMGANGPNVLGYRHPEVEAAVDRTRSRITTASLFPDLLVEVIEGLVETVPAMAWGVVAKNGSEVVSLGARVARQHTGRRAVVAFEQAYHGNDPELALGAPAGPLAELTDDVHRLPWNDPQRLVDHAAAHADRIAAIVCNPLHQSPRTPTLAPSSEFVSAIAQVREESGILVVFDDVRHGMRLHPEGSHVPLGLEPDLIALGKAIGNGHSISGLLGTDEVRRAARKIMFTSTYMFEAPPMAAAITTRAVYERDDAHGHMERMGRRLCEGLAQRAAAAGVGIELSGPSTMPTLLFRDDADGGRARSFAREAAEHGAIMPPFLNWNLSSAHEPADIDAVLAAATAGFEAVSGGPN
ncbi:MAG: aminotransferase class III-fold pyridoxal phosphate-dependent enzyme [Actinomycetota bacterium]